MKKAKIMIVEDEFVVAQHTRDMLVKLGYDVCWVASTGEEGLILAQQKHPDLILMDIILRGEIDGINAAQKIRDRMRVPIIFVTGFADEIILQRAKLSEPFGYLIKPFTANELRTTIELILYKAEMEKKDREKEEMLNALLNAPSDSAMLIDKDGILLATNKVVSKQFEKATEELIGQPLYDYFSSENAAEVKVWVNQVIRTGRPVQFENSFNSKIFENRLYPVRNDDGEVDRIAGISRDVTEMKRATAALQSAHDELETRVQERTAELAAANRELQYQIDEREQTAETLRESEKKYSRLVENLLTGIYINLKGKIIFANKRFTEIFGYERDEMLGMDSDLLVHPDERHHVQELFQKNLSGKNVPTEYEVQGVRKDGQVIWLVRNLSLIEYEGQTAVLGNVLDITMRKHMEKELQRSEQQLRLLSSQLLSAEEQERKRIARELHDGIGQSLSAIKFGVENSLRELGHASVSSPSALEAIIPLVQQTIKEVRSIVEDLRPSILDDLGILATIGWVCREFQKVYARIQVEKQLEIEEHEIPELMKTVIYRILQEALNNVAKHSLADQVKIWMKKKNTTIEWGIYDNGIGFDMDKLMFLKSPAKGFGLASMRERAELTGADFHIRSKHGEGTTIYVSWPDRCWVAL